MSDLEGAAKEENPPPPYIIFVVVFLFFVTGLCGFLFCHLLKLKGYRCTMEEEDEDDEEELDEEQDDDNEENQDTVEQILKCIIENEANMEAFNEMLGKGNLCVRHDPRLRKESIAGIPPHLHTVHSGTDLHNTCHLCAQSRSKRGRRPSRTPRFRQRSGEQTVFSVGRFRVTHTDKKSTDSSGRVPDVLVGSGDHLDQSHDSEERRDGGYSLRNLFKDVRPPSENTNSLAPGKRRRSLTIFGLRRGSDPIGVKVVSTGREGVRFIPQPVVLEEPQHENGENGTKDVSTLRRRSLEIAASRIKASSDASVIKPQMNNSLAVESSTQGTNQTKNAPTLFTSAPNTLPVPLTSSPKSPQTVGSETNQQTQLSPGPLQTSTPLSPLPDPGEAISQFAAETGIPQGLPGSQTPPDPCTSPVLEHDSFASPALISLGSSPHSSVRTPTSPIAITPSPKFSAKVSSQLASTPKLLSSQPGSSPMRSLDKSMGSLQTSTPSVSLKDDALPLETTSQESSLKGSASQTNLQGPTTQQSMPELKNLGVLDGDKSSPQLSPSSPLGGRVSSVTVVKASPDSKREFSVVTMVEEQKGASKVDIEESVNNEGAEVKWTLGDEKEDMVEMEAIAECRVTQAGEVRTEEKVTDEATQD